MFWIVGGSGFALALCRSLGLPSEGLAEQMTHVSWEGFRFFDLIFPLFVFMSGITVPYSVLSKKRQGISTTRLQLGIVKRAALLILFGLSFSLFRFDPSSVRLYTVLWLIGMSYLIGASISLHLSSWKHQLAVFFAVLVSYHIVMLYLPFPGKEVAMTPSNNLAAYLDRTLVTTNLYRGDYDPEGSIRVITGGMLCLLGSLVGRRIKAFATPSLRCGLELFGAGLVFLLLGFLWSFAFPIIKDLWSPSFILWAAGWSLLLLSLFYTVLDVFRQKWLGFIFIPIGMNAITIYLAQVWLDLHHTNRFFFGGFAGQFENPDHKALVLSFGYLLIQWLLLFFLYRKKIFLRV